MMMWRIFGPWMNENACECRTIYVYNDGLIDLYCSPKKFRLIKLSRIKCAGHEAYMGDWKALYRALGLGDLGVTFYLGVSNVDWRTLLVLRYIFRK